MVSDRLHRRSPPYVSYRTFRNFIDELQHRMPARIDRSYWGERLSGSTGVQLMAALRFMGLVDGDGVPTERLRELVSARGAQRNELLRQIAYEAFDFVLRGRFDPQTATYAQIQEVFQNNFQLTGDVNRKCLKFFVALASEVDVPLSPFITSRMRVTTAPGTKGTTRKSKERTNKNSKIPQKQDEMPKLSGWSGMLLEKFPTFDPSWSEEVKLKWFAAFDALLARGGNHGEK
jgi:hypothetical protein